MPLSSSKCLLYSHMPTEIKMSGYYVCVSQYSFQDFGSTVIKYVILS